MARELVKLDPLTIKYHLGLYWVLGKAFDHKENAEKRLADYLAEYPVMLKHGA
jgi:hypothetical protein